MMFSIVTPSFNSELSLSNLLLSLKGERIIVTDGGSTDNSLEIAVKGGASLAVGSAGRGPQLARGAQLALLTDADWLLFLHSDTKLPKNWRRVVEKHIRNRPDSVGYFRYAVQARGVLPLVQAFLVALRCWWWKMPYGDQGLLIPKAVYLSVGGYGDMALFEDVDMMNRLKAQIGRFRIHRLSGKIYTDISAYKDQGWWARGSRNFKLFKAYQRGASPDELKKIYYADIDK